MPPHVGAQPLQCGAHEAHGVDEHLGLPCSGVGHSGPAGHIRSPRSGHTERAPWWPALAGGEASDDGFKVGLRAVLTLGRAQAGSAVDDEREASSDVAEVGAAVRRLRGKALPQVVRVQPIGSLGRNLGGKAAPRRRSLWSAAQRDDLIAAVVEQRGEAGDVGGVPGQAQSQAVKEGSLGLGLDLSTKAGDGGPRGLGVAQAAHLPEGTSAAHAETVDGAEVGSDLAEGEVSGGQARCLRDFGNCSAGGGARLRFGGLKDCSGSGVASFHRPGLLLHRRSRPAGRLRGVLTRISGGCRAGVEDCGCCSAAGEVRGPRDGSWRGSRVSPRRGPQSNATNKFVVPEGTVRAEPSKRAARAGTTSVSASPRLPSRGADATDEQKIAPLPRDLFSILHPDGAISNLAEAHEPGHNEARRNERGDLGRAAFCGAGAVSVAHGRMVERSSPRGGSVGLQSSGRRPTEGAPATRGEAGRPPPPPRSL